MRNEFSDDPEGEIDAKRCGKMDREFNLLHLHLRLHLLHGARRRNQVDFRRALSNSLSRLLGRRPMKFADIEGNVREAQPGLKGKCRDCGQPMVAKCGQHRVWHWAHLKSKACDPWWEPETEWHRSWKNQFPAVWQEIGHTAQGGERHRADVKTEKGLVLEFQYSALSETERDSREEFYARLVWVVHAHRRLRDRKKFFASLSGPLRVASGLATFSIHRDDSALLRDWGKSRAPVYFDFGET
jgi:competence protein CoiA